MRHHLISIDNHLATYRVVTLLLTILLMAGLFVAQPTAAQIPYVRIVGYGQMIAGEVTSASGTEHFLPGCVGEVVTLSVTANDFVPRVELYSADADVALESATASTGNGTVILEGVSLPASGLYSILVSGRSRGDRGSYSVTVQGMSADERVLDDGVLDNGAGLLNIVYDEVVTGMVLADRNNQWNFRGCEGDEIHAEMVGDGFAPELQLYSLIAENPIATAVAAMGDGGFSAEFRRTLPASGFYNLIASGTTSSETRDYSLGLYLEGTATPGAATPTVIAELSPTPTPSNTPGSGPRVRRGIPTPKANSTPNATPTATPTVAQGPTATLTPTPEFIMPGLGEGAFRVLDVSSEGGPVNHVAYSPDGTIIATAGEDGAVRAWDALSGELLQTLSGHEARVNYVAFAPNDELLASAGDDGTVRLWNQAGQEVAALEVPSSGVNSVAFSPDSTDLVATTDEGDVLVWDVGDESVRLELEGHQGPTYHAVFSPDGSLIGTGDGVGVVRLWDASDGALVDSMPVNAGPGSGDPILSLAFGSDDSALVVGGVIGVNEASVHIVDVVTGDTIAPLMGHDEWGSSAVISPDSGYILSAGRAEPGHDGPVTATARLWRVETGELAIAFVGYPSSVVAAAFRPDGAELLTSDGINVYIWPAPMISVFAATFGEAVGVQIPATTPVVTSIAPNTTPRATPTAIPIATPSPTATPFVTRALSPTATATVIPTATMTPTPITPAASLEIFCTVITDHLNLRPGPGTNFNPPITVLEIGEILVVVGRNQDSSWLQVAVLDDNLEVEEMGWVSADFIFCVGEIDDAPVMEVE